MIKFTDGRGNVTTYSYDALNRKTGMTQPAALSLVQQTGVEGAPASSTSVSFTSPVTAGDLVVVAVGTWSVPSVSSFTVSDNKGNTYTQAVLDNTGSTRTVAIYYAIVSTGGSSFQVTVTPSASAYTTIAINEYSGVGAIAVDTTGTGNGTSTTPSAGSLVLSGSGELVAMMTAVDYGGITYTAGSGFSLGFTANNGTNESGAYENDLSGSGTVTASLSLSANDNWTAAAAAFQLTGYHTTFVYDAAGNLLQDQEPTPAGQTARTTTYAYDSMNRVVTVTDPLGNQTIHGYDAAGNQTSVKDALGRISTTIYDALNRPTVTVDPMNNRTTVTYDAEGEKLTVTDAMNRITTYTYSIRGWVATVTDPMDFVTTYIYTPTGRPSAQDQTGGAGPFQVGGYTYDKDDREIAFEDALGYFTTYTYDGVGNRIAVTDANINITSYAYDSRSRLTTITDALGHTTVYGYDGSGNQQTVTDGLGHTTTTLYDALNRATTIISAINGTTTITYDAAGRKTSLTDPDGNTTRWAYDADDRMTSMTDPLGHTGTYVYDADGEMTDTTDRDGRRTTYSYNADGDQTGETWVGASPSEKITYTYDADNEQTGAADSYATLTIVYDNDGRVGTIATSGPGTGQPTVTLTYSYDQLGDETSVTDSLSSQGITTYSYDNAQRLTTITTSYGGTTGPQVTYTYDPANRMTAVSRTVSTYGTQVNTTIVYDAAGRETTITHWSYVPPGGGMGGGTATPLATYVYGYDNANRVTTEIDAEGTATFTYDNANELTAVGGSRTESYSYDINGNRNSTGYTTGTGNELTASPGVTYTYDAEGNLLSQTNTSTHVTTTYTYDYRNRLTGVTVGGTIVATYIYDAFNRRIGIKDSGTQTWTVYDGKSTDAHPYADFNGSGSLTERYLSGLGVVNGAAVDQLLARTSAGGTTAWYLPDKLGSVRDIVNTSGTELDHIVYDSFGNIVTETNASNGDRFKFAGMVYDSATGQYYDRARFYNPLAGRFSRLDPLVFSAGDVNLYRYVINSPSNYNDPSGEILPAVPLIGLLGVMAVLFSADWNPAGGEIGNHPSEHGNPGIGVALGVLKAYTVVKLVHGVLHSIVESITTYFTDDPNAVGGFIEIEGQNWWNPNCFIAGTRILMAPEYGSIIAYSPGNVRPPSAEADDRDDTFETSRLLGVVCILVGIGGPLLYRVFRRRQQLIRTPCQRANGSRRTRRPRRNLSHAKDRLERHLGCNSIGPEVSSPCGDL